ncbi:MAG TPA: 1-deoxy-D-xylulose-5-phosphate synthase [Spirochaetaceae bacterium]|nr:1-deoxy-D-xylulose-5-phosphate synthase [Spirochaetaceae bacterium]
MDILTGIQGPEDVKRLSLEDAYRLAGELRQYIVATVAVNGGHLASNLGTVELTLALHRVFSTPLDSIVWDVGHQSYTHKIITGRRAAFSTIRRSGGLSGFPKRAESAHDAFDAGHASTSLSAALGLLIAKRALAKKDAVIAVIGDGALTGGMAYEALSHAGQLGLPLIVILNDNSMSISPNVGAVSSYLSRLTTTVSYQNFRRLADKAMLMIPLAGTLIHDSVQRAKKSVKAFFFKESLFADLGFEYAGPIDGHNIAVLEDVLRQARAIDKPVVVHVTTKKGRGHKGAEDDPSTWHGVAPADALASLASGATSQSFTQAFGAAMVECALADERVMAVSAAMAKGTGLSDFQRRFPKRFFDVGIAEEHAVTLAAGMAAGGLRPVVAIYSTFMQRAVDQVQHDIALGGLPVIFALDRAGAVPDDGETHQGIYDIQLFRAVPGLSIVAPASALELKAALAWALTRDAPLMLRFPKDFCPGERACYALPFESAQGVFLRQAAEARGSTGRQRKVLLIGSGPLSESCDAAADIVEAEGIGCDVYHLRFLKPFDPEGLARIMGGYELVVAAEEGVLTGSVAADLAALAQAQGLRAVALGFSEQPLPQGSRAELLALAGLDARGIAAAVARNYPRRPPEPHLSARALHA